MSFDRNAYAQHYATILDRWIGHGPSLVELGAFRGSGLAVWCDLFPDGEIVGLDVRLEHFFQNLPVLRSRGAFAANIPTVLEFDAYAPDTSGLEAKLGERPIDIFIDDGPHKEVPSLRTAGQMRALMAPRFTYVVEYVNSIYSGLHDIFAGCEIEQVAKGLVVITEGVSPRDAEA